MAEPSVGVEIPTDGQPTEAQSEPKRKRTPKGTAVVTPKKPGRIRATEAAKPGDEPAPKPGRKPGRKAAEVETTAWTKVRMVIFGVECEGQDIASTVKKLQEMI